MTSIISMNEEQFHKWTVDWLRITLPKGSVVHHSPNEGMRKMNFMRKLKTLGTNFGWPDLELFVPKRHWLDPELFAPIFFELKNPVTKGRISKNQREIGTALQEADCHIFVVHQAEQIENELKKLITIRIRENVI